MSSEAVKIWYDPTLSSLIDTCCGTTKMMSTISEYEPTVTHIPKLKVMQQSVPLCLRFKLVVNVILPVP